MSNLSYSAKIVALCSPRGTSQKQASDTDGLQLQAVSVRRHSLSLTPAFRPVLSLLRHRLQVQIA